eukprot:6194523-Pleurochrysis_carterae.AAC.2
MTHFHILTDLLRISAGVSLCTLWTPALCAPFVRVALLLHFELGFVLQKPFVVTCQAQVPSLVKRRFRPQCVSCLARQSSEHGRASSSALLRLHLGSFRTSSTYVLRDSLGRSLHRPQIVLCGTRRSRVAPFAEPRKRTHGLGAYSLAKHGACGNGALCQSCSLNWVPQVKMVTGDHVSVAKEICHDLGLGHNVVERWEMPKLASMGTQDVPASLEQFGSVADAADGFAGVTPEQKVTQA